MKVPIPPDATCYAVHKNYHTYDPNIRPPMGACYVKTVPAVPPKPDITNPDSLLLGIAKRMAYSPPPYDRNMRRKFRKFVKKWLVDNLDPISPDYKFNFEEWLESTNYPEWRKEEIRKAYPQHPYSHGEVDAISDDNIKTFDVNLFCKEEYYPEYKHFRGIWARTDAAKAIMGPFFRKIEKTLFSLPYFIKKVPKKERPQYINDFMNNNYLKFQGTDYTSFESHFTTDMMDDCEFMLYRHMSSMNPEAQMRCRLIFDVLASENYAKNKYFTVKVDAKRMSGEMNTSLGNGFSNLMFLLFAVHYYKREHSGPIIEGDDALIGLSDRIPSEYYDKMGLNVKMEFVDDISEGSFCGLVYDPQELINIRDPREPLCTTTWVTRKYAFSNRTTYYSLLRSKALSLMFEYPQCPIIYKYGRKIFELLSAYEIKHRYGNNYDNSRFKEAHAAYVENRLPQGEPGPRTRQLMEKIFKVPVELQLRIEQEIDLMTVDNMNLPSVLLIVPDCWITNYDNYVLSSTYQTQKTLSEPMFVDRINLNVDNIIKVTKTQLKQQHLLTEKQFFSSKLNKDPKLYKIYVDRFHDAQQRLRNNSQPIV